MTAVTAVVTATWNVAESIHRIGVSPVCWLSPWEYMILFHEEKQARKCMFISSCISSIILDTHLCMHAYMSYVLLYDS